MDYQVTCPFCRSGTAVMAVQIGQSMRCPHCHETFQVAMPSSAPGVPIGRPFSFMCAQCSSRLEAHAGMVGQRGQCPTCGVEFTIPAPFGKGFRVGGTEPENEYAQPVHAYAAAGDKAPRILRGPDGKQAIECPRCKRLNEPNRNNCSLCAMPFTLEGAEGGSAPSQGNGLATASLVLGIVGVPGSFILVPSLLALVFGFLSLRGQTAEGGSPGRGSSIAGTVLGAIGVLLFLFFHFGSR